MNKSLKYHAFARPRTALPPTVREVRLVEKYLTQQQYSNWPGFKAGRYRAQARKHFICVSEDGYLLTFSEPFPGDWSPVDDFFMNFQQPLQGD